MLTTYQPRNLLLATALLLSGCASSQPNLYHWGKYESTLYRHYQPDKSSLDEQIASLQETVAQASKRGNALPPGLQAHLGMLYTKAGERAQAEHCFAAEKDQFPESATFIDFLLSNQKTKGAK